jgi:hypothetical protein
MKIAFKINSIIHTKQYNTMYVVYTITSALGQTQYATKDTNTSYDELIKIHVETFKEVTLKDIKIEKFEMKPDGTIKCFSSNFDVNSVKNLLKT